MMCANWLKIWKLNLFAFSYGHLWDTEKRCHHCRTTLPENLQGAIQELKKDQVVQEALGEHLLDKFIRAKEIEWESYRAQVHSWETEEYLTKF